MPHTPYYRHLKLKSQCNNYTGWLSLCMYLYMQVQQWN